MSIDAKLVKELRERTGQPMMECKKALVATEGDLGAAEEHLRKQGAKVAEKKAHRETAEGAIGTYLHHDGKTAVMVEVNCETDFVAKNEDFKTFVKDLSLQVCAYSPLAVRREDLDPALVEKELEIIRAQIEQDEKNRSKPDQVKEKIAEGRLKKFFAERVLMEQPFLHDADITVEQRRQEIVQKVRENVTVRRFVRYHVGEE